MLQSIRDRAQGVIAAVIVLLLCLTFAIWGIESYLNSARKVVVAAVDGDDIELKEYQSAYQRMRQRAQAEQGEAFDPKVWEAPETKLKALDYLVEDRLLQRYAERARLRVSDAQVAEYFKSSPNFQVDGKFSPARFKEVASMLGFGERAFEREARKDLELQQLRAGVVASSFLTIGEIQALQQLRDQKRTVAYALIAPVDPSKIAVADADVAAYYAEHKEAYRTKDKVALQFLELSLDKLKTEIQVDEKSLKTYYDAHQADFTVEEQRDANHILVKLGTGASAADDTAAKEKAQRLREMVVAGKSIEDVAKEHSDDIGSRAEGGATGYFGKGVMVPEFEQAVFAMKVGELSEPVKTKFGYHIIKLKEIRPGGVSPLAEVHAKVEEKYRLEQAQEQFFEKAEAFNDAVYAHPDSLEAAAEKLDLKVDKTPLQSHDDIGAQFNAAVADAVWQPEVLTEGLASAPIEVGQNRIVAVRVVQREQPRIPELQELKKSLVSTIQTERAKTQASASGEVLLARMKKGEAPEAVVSSQQLKWDIHKDVGREDTGVNRAVLRAAFGASLPKADSQVFLGVALGTGSFAVLQVSNLSKPAIEQIDKTTTRGLRRDAERVRAAIDWRDFVVALKARSKVEMFSKNL
ncbi:MAG: SurA N-terminal domain-containing protein [Gammaproteobacteria bacterium]|nr:SurA N-terminal domain-containing protein [Gammaproteobacteria bacterium]